MGDFEWAYRRNVLSTFRLIQLCAPHMRRAGGGAVLNISSMAGENTNSVMSSYASSKAAVNHLTCNIAYDLGRKDIRANAIAPGGIKTHALATVLTPEIERRRVAGTPLAQLGQPGDMARWGAVSVRTAAPLTSSNCPATSTSRCASSAS